MQYEIMLKGTLVLTPDENDDPTLNAVDVLRGAFDGTMQEMLKLPDLQDPSVSGSAETGAIVLTATVDGRTYGEAVTTGDSAMRTALHAAGVGTEAWNDVPQHIRIECTKVEAEELVNA